MKWDNWKDKWTQTCEAVRKLGGESEGFTVLDKATEEQVVAVEEKIGMRLPECFRKVVLEFASGVDFSWYLPEDLELPEALGEIFGGQFTWSLKNIAEVNESKDSWVSECFADETDPYDSVWHNKLGLMEVGNGDFIAFDLDEYPKRTPIVYLSHDGGEGHGCVLGSDFVDFMDRLTDIGCVGLEDWQLLPFVDCFEEGINPWGRNGEIWRGVMGIEGACKCGDCEY